MITEFNPSRRPYRIPLDTRAIEIIEEYMSEYNFTFAKALNLYIINASKGEV